MDAHACVRVCVCGGRVKDRFINAMARFLFIYFNNKYYYLYFMLLTVCVTLI